MAEEAAAAKTETAPATGGKGGGMMGMILGVVVLLAIGVGVGIFVPSLLKPKGDAHAAPDEHAATAIEAAHTREISLGDLVTNIAGTESRRFLKVTCVVWVSEENALLIGGGEAGEGKIQVKRLLQMALEEQLKRYDLAELSGRGAVSMLAQDFQVVLENALHQHYPNKPKDHRFIKKVILNNLLVQ